MFKMISYIRELAGKDCKRLILPIFLSVIDSLLNSCMYGIMLLLLLDLSAGNFTYNQLRIYTASLAVIFLFRCIAQAISFTQAQCIGPDVTHRLRLQLGNHLCSLNLGFFNKNSIGRLTGTLLTDINEFESIITHCLCDFIKVISFTLLSLVTAFLLNWKFGLVLMILAAIAFPLLLLSGKSSAESSAKLRQANQNVTSRIVEYVEGMKTFRLYNLIGSHFERLDQALKLLRKASIRAEISVLPSALSFSAITSFIVPAALIMGTSLFTAKEVNSAGFLLILLLSVSIASILGVLSSLYPQVRSIAKASESILSVLHENPLPYQREEVCFKNYDVEFSNVLFQYTDDIPVLNNISFIAKQGTTTALIGPSGSGKTTIVSLLARFWDVQDGCISISGEKIKEISPDALTKYISIVFQDVYLLNDTVLNNIRIGKPKATKEEIIQAAKAANCHEFITQMEQGYDTVIGEGGSTLSGGERQRISIARALLKNASIVLLDETTSNLDADNEHEIQTAIHELMKKKTVLVIAHRLGTILNADNILVLDKGTVRESGTHQELVEKRGWYAAMYQEQRQAQDWEVAR
ncbi:MAG: ABC transporter ATP-binding protein [Lachnospiraceae bacterium]